MKKLPKRNKRPRKPKVKAVPEKSTVYPHVLFPKKKEPPKIIDFTIPRHEQDKGINPFET